MLWPVVPAFPGRRFGGRRFVLWSGTDLLRAFSALWSRIPGTAECRVRALRQGAEEGIDGSDQRGWAARCPHLPLRLEVRTFNQRARKQYEAAGFHAVRQYERPTPAGVAEFLPMEWPLNRKGHAALLLLSFHHTCPSTNRQAAVAATEPSAAAVVSWRRVLVRQSPAVKTPEVLVRQSSPATI